MDGRASIVVLFLAGCFSFDGTSPPEVSVEGPSQAGDFEQPRVRFDQFCERQAELYVEHLNVCYGGYNDSDTVRFAADCLKASDAVDARRLLFDEEAGWRCLRDLEGSMCESFMFFTPESCQALFAGVVAEGADCDGDNTRYFVFNSVGECANGSCDMAGECVGHCRPFAALDEPCSDLYLEGPKCDPAVSFCDAGTCAALRGEGQPCTYDECESGLVCDDAVCSPIALVGESCTEGQSCSGGSCVLGICRAKVATGEPCNNALSCPAEDACLDGDGAGTDVPRCEATRFGLCRTNLDCDFGVPTEYCDETSHCVDLPKAGSECAPGNRCAPGAWCTEAGLCAEKSSEGEGCLDNGTPKDVACAQGLACTSGVCEEVAPAPPPEDACSL